MNIKIIEKYSIGKKEEQHLNEDLIFTGQRFFAVIDGATSKNDLLIESKSTGRMAAELVQVGLSILDKDEKELSFYDIQKIINDEFIKVYNRYFKGVSKNIKMTASAIIYDSFMEKLYFVGDCQALILKNNEWISETDEKRIDIITSNKRAKKIKNLLENGHTVESLLENDLGRKYIMGDLLYQTNYQNNLKSPFGYFVFDGSEIPERKIKVVDVSGINELILTSDGFLKVFPELKECENYLNEVIKEDPLMFKIHPSTKGLYKGQHSFDDRTFLKLKIN